MVMLHDYKKVIAKWLYSGYKLRMLYSLKHFKLVLSFNFQKSDTGLNVQYSIADAGLKVNHTILEGYLYGNVAYALLCKLINVTSTLQRNSCCSIMLFTDNTHNLT